MYNDMNYWTEQRNSNRDLLQQIYAETEKETKESVSIWNRIFAKRS